MNKLHKKGAPEGPMVLDHPRDPESHAVQLELNRKEDAEPDESSGDIDGIPLVPGRELIRVGDLGGKCYRLEKTRCGKKSCRCTRGELHGPYWYAYYRENGRMRCEYIGKNLPELVSLENRARKARKSSQLLRERAAKTAAEVKETLRNIVRFRDTPKPSGQSLPKAHEGIYIKEHNGPSA